MIKIDLRTNVSFFIIFLSVLILAILQGGPISNALLGKNIIPANDIQIIAFIILTLFILFVVTLHPDKIYLSAYSSMTLGLVVIISSFYNMLVNQPGFLEFILGLILIIGGFSLYKKNHLSKKEKRLVEKGLDHFNK